MNPQDRNLGFPTASIHPQLPGRWASNRGLVLDPEPFLEHQAPLPNTAPKPSLATSTIDDAFARSTESGETSSTAQRPALFQSRGNINLNEAATLATPTPDTEEGSSSMFDAPGAIMDSSRSLWSHPFETLTVAERIRRSLQRLHKAFWFPMGITGKRSKKALRFIGRLGWLCKGLLYATIGAMAIAGAFHTGEAEGPMGVLILLGGGDFSLARLPVLIFLVVGTTSYVIWRFWEGLLGQGSDATYSRWRNLFKYRVAPLVSGSIYVVYIWYLIEVIQRARAYNDAEGSTDSCAPGCWHDTRRGRLLLFWAGTAFALASMMQLSPAFKSSFMAEFPPLSRWKTRIVRFTGRLGYFGRAAAFLAVSALFFQNLRHRTDVRRDPFADALRSLQASWVGQLLLTSIGLALVLYGAHCVTVMLFRRFPTEPPSSIPAGMTWFGLGPSSSSSSSSSSGGHGLTGLLTADPMAPEGGGAPSQEGRLTAVY